MGRRATHEAAKSDMTPGVRRTARIAPELRASLLRRSDSVQAGSSCDHRVVIRYRFGPLDLGRVRFAYAPLYEVLGSFEVLRDRGRQAPFLPWLQAAEAALADADLSLLEAVIPARGYVADFIAPPPQDPAPDIARELARVRGVGAAQVRRELRRCFAGKRPPDAARAILEAPEAGAGAIADALALYWERALAPHWTRVRALLRAEIEHRGRALAERGPLGLFADLHPDLVWRDGALDADVRLSHTGDVELGGRGLLLVPSAFTSGIAAVYDAPWQPTVVYPAPGAGALWEPARDAPGRAALGALLGDRRAEILVALAQPATTLDLAGGLRASRAGVNEHLHVLRRAGLVTPRRDGRAVRYRRTSAGDALVAAAAASSSSSARLASSPPA
jgi:DNA-binding transcriptional ArsR family regulator